MPEERQRREPRIGESRVEQGDIDSEQTHAETSAAEQAVTNEQEALESGEESPG